MERIGRYRILDEAGRGAMGVVYRAQDPAIGRVIAIKTIRLTDLSDAQERQRLRDRLFREAQSAGSLSHPNIVTIYDIQEEDGSACIFMEFVNGPTLERLMEGHEPPDRNLVRRVFEQTAGALDYAHRKGIVHRDIKPANLMIHEGGQAKITDFGVAKIVSQQMTQGGGMMGTPNYMSPEQVQGGTVDGRADQFSLAVIAYELLTGEKPFAGDSLASLLFKIVKDDPAPVGRLNRTVGEAVDAVLRKGLAKDPGGRFGTCGEFVGALTEALGASAGWVLMPRGASSNMETVGTRAPVAARVVAPVAAPVAVEKARGGVWRGLAWVLAGMVAVGLALVGVQRAFFEDPAAVAVVEAPVAAVEPEKPSPVEKRQVEKTNSPRVPLVPQPVVASPVVQQPGGVRSIQVLTDPPGATVTMDGNAGLSCKTPCMLSAPVGRHALSTELAGYRPYPRILIVTEDSDVYLQLTKASGTLSLTSVPPGAAIQINGETKSQKTPAVFVLQPGEYKVRVVREGTPLEFQVQVKDGEFQTRNVSFQ